MSAVEIAAAVCAAAWMILLTGAVLEDDGAGELDSDPYDDERGE